MSRSTHLGRATFFDCPFRGGPYEPCRVPLEAHPLGRCLADRVDPGRVIYDRRGRHHRAAAYGYTHRYYRRNLHEAEGREDRRNRRAVTVALGSLRGDVEQALALAEDIVVPTPRPDLSWEVC